MKAILYSVFFAFFWIFTFSLNGLSADSSEQLPAFDDGWAEDIGSDAQSVPPSKRQAITASEAEKLSAIRLFMEEQETQWKKQKVDHLRFLIEQCDRVIQEARDAEDSSLERSFLAGKNILLGELLLAMSY